MNKKTLITISIIVGVIILIITGYFIFRSGAPEERDKTGVFSFFFPVGEDRLGPGAGTEPAIQPGISEPSGVQLAGRLVQLTSFPSSKASFNKDAERIRYLEKSTGHIYEIGPKGENKKQITITTIPKVFEVFWSHDSLKIILRYLNENNGDSDIRNFSVYSLATEMQPGPAEGLFLPTNISAVATSPEEDKVFYLVGENEYQGIIASFENKNQKEIFSTPFGNFLANWVQKDILTLNTKPSAKITGYFYKLNPQTGSLTKVLGGLKGLTALYSPLNSTIFYSQSIRNSMQTKIFDEDKKETTELSYQTLPEKCVFSKSDENIIYCAIPKTIPLADYPDAWYQGLISFEDTLWRIDLSGGPTKNLLSEDGFDMINLLLDPQEKFLFFQNKKDSTLWSLEI